LQQSLTLVSAISPYYSILMLKPAEHHGACNAVNCTGIIIAGAASLGLMV